MDLENIGSAPDIDNFDASKLDRGDALVVEDKVEQVVEDKVEDVFEKDEQVEDKVEGKVDEAEDDDKSDDKVEDKARDEKGRFEAKIPKSRFDEAVGKERDAREAAERRAAELERQLKAGEQQAVRTQEVEAIEANITKLEEKHAELLLDGNSKEAAAVMKDIRMAERSIARAEADTLATQRTAQALEAQRFDTVIARIEADHPQFNPESELYDTDLVELVLSKQASLMRSQGLSPSVAMDKAAADVAGRFLKAAEPEKKEDTKGLAAKAVADRKQEQVQKNLDTLKRQPSSMKDAGVDSDKLGKSSEMDISTMTADELAALPESTRAKLRGDYL